MKLKPCPLCESEVKRDQRLKKILSHVKNTDCPLDGLYASDKEWNNRPGEKAARVEALEELEKITAYAGLLEIMFLPKRESDPNHPSNVADAKKAIKLMEATK